MNKTTIALAHIAAAGNKKPNTLTEQYREHIKAICIAKSNGCSHEKIARGLFNAFGIGSFYQISGGKKIFNASASAQIVRLVYLNR